MLRSLFAGVSGMRMHQLNMDVIADNIANVNTTGFKASRMTFKEVYSQLLRGAREPKGALGGVNPLQVGLGVTIGSIDTLFAQGAPQSTGRDTDLAIDGNGFFILTSDDGNTWYFTRAGNFSVDSAGNLVYANGMKVMGWNADIRTGNINTEASIAPLVIPTHTTIDGQATTSVVLGGNLDSRLFGLSANNSVTMSFDVVDSLGDTHTVFLTFTPDSTTPRTWQVQVGVKPPATVQWTQGSPTSISFDTSGRPVTPSQPLQIKLNPGNGVAASSQTISLDWSQMTQYAQESEPTMVSQNGYPPGSLVRFTIDDAGVINGVFSNGVTRNLGQIALATFPNQEGLIKQSDTLFAKSPNSGEPVVGQPNLRNRGKLVAGFLEMSNVDLSQEFTNLILAQRGFQANSRVITTSDELLQELMTLKR